ncbi:MAG TPA: hypothetical protein VF988_15550, partial [Verrucomicrobiae bacterium]
SAYRQSLRIRFQKDSQGVYTNAIIFSNAGNQFFGSGRGITNLSFNSLAGDSQAQITNIASGAAAAAVIRTAGAEGPGGWPSPTSRPMY